jgi:pimeloyl-ACP methyl ester carboxylesterase
MLTHFPERDFGDESKSRIILSRNPSGSAAVFVHGYGGNAIATWTKFDSLLPSESPCSGHDLVFYGYDGLRSEAVASGSLFLEFLEGLFSNGAELINRLLPTLVQRSEDFRYNKIIVVAHSLGAVVSRWALVAAHETGRPWANNLKLVLFAPAHRGANVVKIALQAATGFQLMQVLSAVARFRSPLIDELAPDSDVLNELQERVDNLVGPSGDHCLLARAVFIAEREHVVKNLPFSRDPFPIAIADTDHFSVCKPQRAADDRVRKLCQFL